MCRVEGEGMEKIVEVNRVFTMNREPRSESAFRIVESRGAVQESIGHSHDSTTSSTTISLFSLWSKEAARIQRLKATLFQTYMC